MTLDEFRQSLTSSETPPAGVTPLLQALWHDAKGDWDQAHNLAQEVETKDGAWVHAYLHRKEGDNDNAGYWYRRASRDRFTGTLDDEWTSIVSALLGTRKEA
jgi:hypothetical protein